MNPAIKIRAEVLQHDSSSCRFTVDRPVYPGGWARFSDRARAAGSPLAERLLAIVGVNAVMIHDDEVTVTSQPPVDWRAVGPQVGTAIREQFATGQPAVSPQAMQNASTEDQLRQKIQKILDEQVNPAVASHGGFIALLDVRGTDIFIQMGGGCQGCSSANVTLRQGVESSLRQQVPEIGRILDTTDHAAGTNPYYKAH